MIIKYIQNLICILYWNYRNKIDYKRGLPPKKQSSLKYVYWIHWSARERWSNFNVSFWWHLTNLRHLYSFLVASPYYRHIATTKELTASLFTSVRLGYLFYQVWPQYFEIYDTKFFLKYHYNTTFCFRSEHY